MTPFGNLCFGVESEILHVGKEDEEVSSKSRAVVFLGFGWCNESMVGNDNREYLFRQSHVRDI